MVYSFTFPEEIIDSIQERIEVLERCLNDPNPQDEKMAEMIEFANLRQISVIQLKEELEKLIEKLVKKSKLYQVICEKSTKGELPLLLYVKHYFIMKETIDIEFIEFDLYLITNNQKFLRKITIGFVELFNQSKELFNQSKIEILHIVDKNLYILSILRESLKHLLQSLIKAGLKTKIFTEQEINAFNLGDITPQESEAMLISLASTKKWDYVYRKLA
ncbi:hypothetical protein [Sphaerospermopsis sp. FACHB-1194]|jgi:hypothetical protein|uniref:hypothetical protein n=1 Tax=Sphaerospermopsis sp. FACHB-1194 TaxID=2692862 RepID=UPI00167FF636|nr:hypothetical protein [Sphaerospermopsis sp. FACHB-1194]MBD2146402.1 hypothetical protein [Sphaerospermopsis sp. FACHB-1194]